MRHNSPRRGRFLRTPVPQGHGGFFSGLRAVHHTLPSVRSYPSSPGDSQGRKRTCQTKPENHASYRKRSRTQGSERVPNDARLDAEEIMETAEAKCDSTWYRCNRYRDCQNRECMFYEGEEPCWSQVSPFKLRKRPSLLFRDPAEHCMCLDIPCTECGLFPG